MIVNFLPLLVLAAQTQTASISPGNYGLVPEQSDLLVKVSPDSGAMLAGMMHAHVIRASSFIGNFSLPDISGKGCTLLLSTPVKGLEVDLDTDRAGMRFKEKKLDADDRKTIKEHMLAEDQLFSQKYPQISLKVDSCKQIKSLNYQMRATLKVRGKAKSFTFVAQFLPEGGGFSATTRFALKHQDFGFEPYSTALGAVRNGQKLEFIVALKAVRK